MQKRSLILLVVAWSATAAYLAFAAESDRDAQQFFGLWRARHMLLALVGLWLGATALCSAISRRALLGWLFGTFLSGVALALLELPALFGLVDYPLLMVPDGMEFGLYQIPHVDAKGVSFEDLAFTFDHNVREIPFEFRSDRNGFRNAMDRDAADIYLLGDSVLVAGLVPFEQTIASQLEKAAQTAVMNLSLVGVGTHQEAHWLEELALPMQGRILIQFVFEGNDLLDANNPVAQQQRERGYRDRSALNMLLVALQGLTQPRDPAGRRLPLGSIGNRDYLFAWLSNSFEGVEGNFDAVMAGCETARQYVESRGGRYGIVFVPAKIRVLGPLCTWPASSSIQDHTPHLNPMRGWVNEWCKKHGVPLCDLTEAMQAAAAAGEIPWFAGDTHPNGVGHQVMARAVAAWEFVKQFQPPK